MMRAIDKHNLFELIGQRQYVYHSAVMTCYTFDPVFFNTYFMPRLRTCGITNVVVMMDAGNYDYLMEEYPNYNLDASTQTYTLIRQKPLNNGVFHPKIIMLIGQDSGLLCVGSGNLTYSGCSLNEEIWGAFSLHGFDSIYAPLFSDALRYLSHISKSDSKLVNQQFLWMTENSSWLGKIVSDINGLVEKDGETFRFLCNENESIINQVTAIIGNKNIKNLRIISPFYDINGSMINTLYQRLSPEHISCVVAQDGTYPYDFILKTPAWLSFHLWNEVRSQDDSGIKKLHGKLLQFEAEDATYLLIGSANTTNNALNGANDEACILIISDNAHDYFQELGINIDDSNTIKHEAKSSLKKPEKSNRDNSSFIYHILGCEKIDEKIIIYSDCPDDSYHICGKTIDGVKCIEKVLASLKGKFIDSDKRWENASMVVLIDSDSNELSNCCLVISDDVIDRSNPNQALKKLESLLTASGNWKSNLMNILSYVYFDDKPKEKGAIVQYAHSQTQKKEVSEKTIFKDDFDNIALGSKHHVMSMPDVRIIEFLLQTTNISRRKGEICNRVSDDLDGVVDIDDGDSSYSYEIEENSDDLTKFKDSVLHYGKKLDKFYDSKLDVFYKTNKEKNDNILLQKVDGGDVNVSDFSQILICVVLMWRMVIEDQSDRHDLFRKPLVHNLGKFLLLSRKGYEKRNDYAYHKMEEFHRDLLIHSLLMIAHYEWLGKDEIKAKLLILNLLDTYKTKGFEAFSSLLYLYEKEVKNATSVLNKKTILLIWNTINEYKVFYQDYDDKFFIHSIDYNSTGEIIYKNLYGFLYAYDFKQTKDANKETTFTYMVMHPGFDVPYTFIGKKVKSLYKHNLYES